MTKNGYSSDGKGHMNPYFINEPAAISFSGGRTSAYMLYRILEAHGGVLPENVEVAFANTGKEMPQTLDFVQACSDIWGVDIVWLEFQGIKEPPKIVTHATASRNGEPFDLLTTEKQYLPNVVARFCTTWLKVEQILSHCGDVAQVVGIRADEPRRVAKQRGKEGYILPLADDRISKEDIHEFWSKQNFNLDLPMVNGVTDWGNCDLCHMKGYRIKQSIIQTQPQLADWWIGQETKIPTKKDIPTEWETTISDEGEEERTPVKWVTVHGLAKFRSDQPDYKKMKLIATDQGQLFDFLDDETIPCYCGD